MVLAVGNIQAGFDDAGGEQHVVLPVIECRHGGFQLRRRHLAVGDHELDFRHQLPQPLGDAVQILDARADVE